jgi:endonuclease/exonuclease/phosphatase family metal-dependent hydrolase
MNAAARFVPALFGLFLLNAGCSDGALRLRHVTQPRRAAPQPSSLSGETRASLRVATFNAGLAVGVLPHVSERSERVARALGELDVDVLCVQELWRESDWRSVARATASSLPHAIRAEPEPEALPFACSKQEVAPIDSCVRRECAATNARTQGSEQAAACAIQHCSHLAWQISRPCLRCLTRDPLRSLDDIEATCIGKDERVRRSADDRGDPTLGASYGIALFTNVRVLEHDLLRLETEHHPRGVLYTKLETAALGEAHVFCTHLTPVMRNVPHPRGGSWVRHQSRQMDELVRFVERKAPADALVLVLGDLNAGPAAGSVASARSVAQYQRLLDRGFHNPYLERGAARCTHCTANPVAGGQGTGGSIIDHVLVRGPAHALRAERIFDEPLVLDVGGKRVRTALSDHYGVLVELEPAR